MEKPLITISIMTYNHQKYIEETLDSVLKQKTEYPYEIVISDDGSKDRTPEILKKYANRYSDIIKLILHKKNMGILRNSANMRRYYSGQYIAPLDGDDYFIDPYKLQKQAEILENNPQIACVGGRYRTIDSLGNIIPLKKIDNTSFINSNFYTKENFENYKMATLPSTMLYRRLTTFFDEEFMKIYEASPAMGDRKLHMALLSMGNIKILDDIFTAYRIRNNGYSISTKKYCNNFYAYFEMDELRHLGMELFNTKYDFRQTMLRAWFGTCVNAVLHPTSFNIQAVKMLYSFDSDQKDKILFLISHILNWPARKIFCDAIKK